MYILANIVNNQVNDVPIFTHCSFRAAPSLLQKYYQFSL